MMDSIGLTAIPRPIPTCGLPKVPTTISAVTTSSTNSNTKMNSAQQKPLPPKRCLSPPRHSPPDPNKPVINPITNRKSYDHIIDRELRKKLKNRESAQAARDRKKAKMMALERQLGDMADRNKFLENENRELKSRLQRVEAEAFWRLVKQPGENGNMEANPMMPNGMHPNMHPNMHVDGQQIPPELHQLHQRQMQLLFENGGFNQAAMQQGQNPTPMQIQNQQQQSQKSDRAETASISDIESTDSNPFATLRLPKGEPFDAEALAELASGRASDLLALTARRFSLSSASSELAASVNPEHLDDWILRNFKGEGSPLSNKAASTGYSSGTCDSPDHSAEPASPEFAGNWVGASGSNRTSSSDSGCIVNDNCFSQKLPPFKLEK